MYFAGVALPQPGAVERGGARRRAGRVKTLPRGGPPADRAATRPQSSRSHRDAFFDALAEDFNTPARARGRPRVGRRGRRREGAGDAHLREMLGVLGLDNLLDAEPRRRRRSSSSSRMSARPPARPRDYATADRLRDELPRGLGGPRRRRTGRGSHPGCDRLRPQPGARGAARAPPRGRRSGPPKNAAREPWLADAQVNAATRRRDRGALRLRRASGRLRGGRRRTRTRTPRRCSRRPTRSWSRSTRSPTRRTSARSAGRPRSRARPAWSSPSGAPPRSRRRCARRRPGRSSTCRRAGPQPRRLPRRRQARRARGATAPRPRRATRLPGAGLPRRGGAGARRGGQGTAPARRDACDDLIALPVRGRLDSLNVSAAAAVLLYEILQQRLDSGS